MCNGLPVTVRLSCKIILPSNYIALHIGHVFDVIACFNAVVVKSELGLELATTIKYTTKYLVFYTSNNSLIDLNKGSDANITL